jgi:hypothetical protein
MLDDILARAKTGAPLLDRFPDLVYRPYHPQSEELALRYLESGLDDLKIMNMRLEL